jgi:diadenosine tetraphosphate (Ap4A) HIT family hydrolase
VLFRSDLLRIIEVVDPQFDDYPGHLRVILNRHVSEMTDLPRNDAQALLHAVLASERAIREVLAPDKVNLASLGNQVPHLHWHVVPRFIDDSHFPDPVWASRKRDTSGPTLTERRRRAQLIGESLRLALT